MSAKPTLIDEYLGRLPEDQRATLEKVRKAVHQSVPAAEECISYGLAAFRLDGKPLVAMGASTNHCAFYLMSGSIVEQHQADLEGYDTSKGTIRFPSDQPLPAKLIKKLVKARIAENAKLGKTKRKA